MEEGKWNNVQKRKTNKTQQNNLGEMQNQLRCEMSDRSLKLFPSRCVGRVLVDVWEDKLTVFLNNLPKEKEDPWAWSTGKEEIEMEICEDAQCQHSQAEHHKMVRTLKNNYQLLLKECYDYKWDLRWKNEDLESMEKELQQAKAEAKQCPEMELALDGKNPDLEGLEKDLVQERANTEELRMTLNNVMQTHLHERMDAMKAVKVMEDSHKARLDASMAEIETLKTVQKKSEDQCLHLQQERNSLLEEKEILRRVGEALIEARDRQKNSHQTALKEAKQQLESTQIQWQKEKSSLLKETEALRKTLQKKEQESKDKGRAKTSVLDKAQRSLVSCQSQLEEQMKECNTHMAALKEAENQLESSQIQWQKEKSSLLKETEALRKTLLKKEKESKDKGRAKISVLDKAQRSLV